MAQKTSIHAEATLHRKLVLFAAQLEGYLAHFPACHKYTLTQGIRQAFLDVYNLVTDGRFNQRRDSLNPAFAKRFCHQLVGNTRSRRPVLCRKSFPVDGDQDGSSLVSELLAAQRPPTVISRVRPVVLFAFDGVCWRRRVSHIGKKRIKRVAPLLANGYPPTAIVFPRRMLGVFAPLDHAGPAVVQGTLSLGVWICPAVGDLGAAFGSQASARLNPAMAQVGGRDRFFSATVAPAQPCFTAIPLVGFTDHKQPAKPFARQIDVLRHPVPQ